MSDAEREKQRQRGAKGGARRTDAQRQALSKGPQSASAVRSADAVGRAAVVRYWAEQGLSRRQIMAKTGLSEATVKRALRAARDA